MSLNENFLRIMAFALHTIKQKHLAITILLCQIVRNITLIKKKKKSVMEMQPAETPHLAELFHFVFSDGGLFLQS